MREAPGMPPIRQAEVGMRVDHPGQDQHAGCVEGGNALLGQVGTDGLDAPVVNRQVGSLRAFGSDDHAAGDDEVGHDPALISISCAPSHSTRRPISASCSCPLTSVAKWLPASGPTRELKLQAPYGNRISHSLMSPV